MDGNIDIKDFMEAEEIPTWPSEHVRLFSILANMGATVLWIESGWTQQWKLSILRRGHFQDNLATKSHIRAALCTQGNIRLTHNELSVQSKGRRLEISFSHATDEIGLRYGFHRTLSDGTVRQVRERRTLPDW